MPTSVVVVAFFYTYEKMCEIHTHLSEIYSLIIIYAKCKCIYYILLLLYFLLGNSDIYFNLYYYRYNHNHNCTDIQNVA